LKDILASAVSGDENAMILLPTEQGRLLIRLLILHKNNVISDEDWESILVLPANLEQLSKGPAYIPSMSDIIMKFAKQYSKTSLTDDQVLLLISMVRMI
jgi:hypothetical protein